MGPEVFSGGNLFFLSGRPNFGSSLHGRMHRPLPSQGDQTPKGTSPPRPSKAATSDIAQPNWVSQNKETPEWLVCVTGSLGGGCDKSGQTLVGRNMLLLNICQKPLGFFEPSFGFILRYQGLLVLTSRSQPATRSDARTTHPSSGPELANRSWALLVSFLVAGILGFKGKPKETSLF